jgi:hypothetical protein
MGKVFITAVMVLIGMSVSAEDYNYLTFETSSGTTTSVALSNLKITFANGKLVAVNSATSTSLALSELSKMYFSNTSSTGIESVGTSTTTSVKVYTVTGMFIGEFASVNEATQNLKKDVYVVKADDKTFKIAVK